MDETGMDWDWYYEEKQSETTTPEDLWEQEFRDLEREGGDVDVD